MAEDQEKTQEQARNLGVYLHQLFTTMIRGACSTVPLRPEMILISGCRIFGNVIARHYGGDAEAVKRFRDVCRAQFSEGVDEIPIPEKAEEQARENAA